MIGFDRQRRMFAAQFQPDGVGFLYRNHTIGEPIPISAAERARYVAAFGKFTRYGFWAMIAGAALLLVAFLLYSMATKSEVPDTVSWPAFGLMVIAYMVAYLRAWNFPARDLRRRK
jgi:hypothetical protein